MPVLAKITRPLSRRLPRSIASSIAQGAIEDLHDGISLDFVRNRFHVKAPGRPAQQETDFTRLFTFTGGSQSYYRGSNGLLVPSATNTPRIEYDANGNLLGLLIEGARTNLCLQSQDIATTWANNRSSESTNTIAAPDGTTTADTLIEDNTNGQHYVTQNITITTGALTVSAFFKAKERSFAVLSINDGTTECVARYDLTTGTVGTVDATLSGAGSIRAYANGWYRCILTVTAANTAGVFRLAMTTTSSGYGYQGDGASGIYVWGAQVEQAAFASSYIPTTAGSVARTVDLATRTFGTEVSQTAGTMFAECDSNSEQAGSNSYNIVSLNDNTNAEYTRLYLYQTTMGITNRDGGATNADIGGGSWSLGTMHKIAGVYEANFINVAVGGTLLTADTSASLPTTDRMHIGSNTSHGDRLFGHIRRLDYWPERKANAFLQQVTT